jgi:hypothetical protein
MHLDHQTAHTTHQNLICLPNLMNLTMLTPLVTTHIPQPQQTPNTAVHVTPSEVNIVNVVYSWSTWFFVTTRI